MAIPGATTNPIILESRSRRMIDISSLRFVDAVGAGICSTAIFITLYYGSLGFLPSTYAPVTEYHPISAWYMRLDISQFFGTLVLPPFATKETWWIGFAVILVSLIVSSIIFAMLLSWSLSIPTAKVGTVFGIALFLLIASSISLGSGYNPAVMRDSVPDVGFFLLGWSGWATLQLLVCSLAYGVAWSGLYRVQRHNLL